MEKKRESAVWKVAMLGMMTALVFVSNYISIPVASSRLHVANAVCLLSGMLLGGPLGAAAAALGSAMFDLTFPAYAAEAWITFINKGVMALICGLIVTGKERPLASASQGGGKKKTSLRVPLGALAGALAYIALYLLKSYIQKKYVAPIPAETLVPVLMQKLAASSVNGAFGVAASSLLYTALRPALHKLLPSARG